MGLALPPGVAYKVQHKYWPDSLDWEHLSDADRMDRQWRAYCGLFDPPLRRLDPNEPDHNVIDNRCEPIIATGVDFLYGDDVEFEVVNDDDTTDEEAQSYLDDVWTANVKMPTLSEYEINSGVFGHGFFKLDPDDPDTAPYPGVSILNPRQMAVVTSPVDVRKVQRYVFTYDDVDDQTGDEVTRREIWERLPDGNWTIREQQLQKGMAPGTMISSAMKPLSAAQMAASDVGWQEIADPIYWGYPWAPVHDAKNMPYPNSYWGRSDLPPDLIHLNNVLNFLLSNRERILYFQGHPKDVFFGVRARSIETTVGGALTIPNTNARVEHIELSGDLAAITVAIEDVRESMDELSHVPSVAVGRLKNLPGVPSGVALKVAYRPLLAKSMQKRAIREALFKRLCQHILELGGYGVDRKIVVHWPAMLPSDDLNEAQTAQIWSTLGVSEDTLMQRGGFNPDVEREKKAEQAERALQEAQERMAAMGPPVETTQDGNPPPAASGERTGANGQQQGNQQPPVAA